MGDSNNLIDLTNSDEEEEASAKSKQSSHNPATEKRRELPATVTTIFRPHQPGAYQPQQQQQPQPSRPSPYEANLQNRQILQTQQSTQIACWNLRICFSLLNSREFTARAELGPVPDCVVDELKRCPGVRFEYNIIRWQFPLIQHDYLFKRLRLLGCSVEGIPRHVIAAAIVQTASSPAVEVVVNELKALGLEDQVINSLAPFQREAVRFVVSKNGRALVADEMGLGKMQSVNSKVLTPNGWTTMGALKPGDRIVGRDGHPTTVTGIFPQGRLPLYRVRFSDGASTLAGAEHLWAVKTPVDDPRGGEWRVLSTESLFPLHNAAGNKQWSVPLVLPVNFNTTVALPVDPYRLGFLLADASCSISKQLKESHKQNFNLLEVENDENCKFNTMHDLKLYSQSVDNMMGDICIPEQYLRTSVTNRLALLQGLMDADGSICSTSGEITISIASPRLADNIQELVWSLGGTASRIVKKTTSQNSHSITVKLPPELIPFRLTKKLEQYRACEHSPLERFVDSIQLEREEEAICIAVDAPDRLYVTDDYIVTHNTRTAIGSACAFKNEWPILILCPSSAKHHWQQELLNVLPPNVLEPRQVTVVESAKHPLEKGTASFDYKVVIISYNMAVIKIQQLIPFNFQVIIADESHYLKSKDSQRTKVLVPMIQNAKRAILLSGTPALSRPWELFCQLNALDPNKWDNMKEFGKRYCKDARPSSKKGLFNSHNRHSWGDNSFKGSNNTTELHITLTATVMIRRLKKDILQQLPPKHRYLLKIDVEDEKKRNEFAGMLSQLSQYEELLAARKGKRNGGSASSSMSALLNGQTQDQNINTGESDGPEVEKKRLIMELFKESGAAKLPAVLRYIEKYLQRENSQKILIFAHHKTVINGLCQYFREKSMDFIKIDGTTTSKDRHSLTQRFQNDPELRVAVLGITAAGIALTLTAANVVFFAEMFWTPGSLIQAEDRAHRIGQLREVNVFYFFAHSSVDELLWPLIRKKMKVFGQFIEGRDNADMDAKTKTKTSGKSSSSKPNVSSMVCSQDVIEVDVEGDVEDDVPDNIISNEEEFEVIAQELAQEEAQAEATVKASSSSKKRKADANEEDSEGDDEASAVENDYEDYLNQPERPDALAITYFQQYTAYMKEQAAAREREEAKRRAANANRKIEIINIEDDVNEIFKTKPSKTSLGVIELISIDSDDDDNCKDQIEEIECEKPKECLTDEGNIQRLEDDNDEADERLDDETITILGHIEVTESLPDKSGEVAAEQATCTDGGITDFMV